MSVARVNPYRAIHLGLPSGDAGVRLTLQAMQAAALGKEGALNPEIRAWALEATQDAQDRNDFELASALFHAVRRVVRFRGEFSETVQTPLVTLQLGAGDCDDHATLMVALLRSIGIPARFKTVATDPSDPRNFNHVYALAGLRRGNKIVMWLPVDTTVPQAHPGWEPSRVLRHQVWGGPVDANLGACDEAGNCDPEPPPQTIYRPMSQKASDIAQVANQFGQSAANIISLFRNTGNTSTLYATRVPGGVQASVGTSQTTLVVGGLVAAGVLVMLLRPRV